ncbi:MAG: glycosyl transferase [Gordonia sp.]|nr:glycosyl transferase [Gordonia sp. (in: high G+C Gram-positive bacteria)]
MDKGRRPEKIVVVVPAHNEQALLPSCLESITAASAEISCPVEVIVVLDDCTDGTAACVSPPTTAVTVSGRSVGQARKVGFESSTWDESTWFATTDADSVVPADWLTTQIDAALHGADVFAGTVVGDDWAQWPTEVAERFSAEYQASDGHRHVHGANLAMWAAVYFGVGGFALVDHDEDVDLVNRLRIAGMSIEWSGRAPVITSTRPFGRLAGGFADHLRGLESAGEAS